MTKRDAAARKRDVSPSERDKLADEGKAMPGGGYPIANVSDLKNAIQAIGRAKDPAATKAHIKRRAKDLGAENLIPDSWEKRHIVTKGEFLDVVRNIAERNALALLAKNAVDFAEAYLSHEVCEDAGNLMCELQEAMCALDCSIQSILCDDDVVDKRSAITTSFNQFKTYIAGRELQQHDPEGEELASKRNEDMTTATLSPQVQKILDEAVAKAVAAAVGVKDAEIAKLNDAVIVAKMSDKHQQYFNSMSDDMEKNKFKGMTPEERDAYMDKARKRADDDPIVKSLRAENDDLRKRLDALEGDKLLEIAKRDAREMGMSQTDAGEVLMKARRGDAIAMGELEKRMVALAKQGKELGKMSKAFDELGHNQRTADGNSASAHDELTALAKELRKSQPQLTEAQAYTKVLTDPGNAELRQRESNERMAKIAGRAA